MSTTNTTMPSGVGPPFPLFILLYYHIISIIAIGFTVLTTHHDLPMLSEVKYRVLKCLKT